MAHLNKLAIRGIRSFDDKQISVIEFFSPVTVIVGHNGSGKTTIIECLKYATTGDQPPNTRGGAFVHDPKMANEKEVKAQVKLRFFAANGQRMLAVRNMSVTVKKTALTFKTLESILAIEEKGGKRGVISTKCAEMDAEIPSLLGVSKAVLENVIFCHQEDSYWPLAEASVLKKKFDDIFEATRYTKALDSIKSLRKDRVAELKAEKERLESLSREKAHGDKLKNRISELKIDISSKEVEHETLQTEAEKLGNDNKAYYDRATKFRETYIKVDQLTARRQNLQEDRDSLIETITIVPDADEEIRDRLANYDAYVAQQKMKHGQKTRELEDQEDAVAALRKEHVSAAIHHGDLLKDEKTHEQNIAEREQLIREISVQQRLKGYEHSPLENHKVTEFLNRLADIHRRQNAELDKIQAEGRAKNEDYQVRLRHLHSQSAGKKHDRETCRTELRRLQATVKAKEVELDSSQTLEAELLHVTSEKVEKQARLDKLKQEIKAANYDRLIEEKAREVRRLEDERESLNMELRKLSVESSTRARLDVKRGEVKTKRQEIKTSLDLNNTKYRQLMGHDAQADTMERELERVIAERERNSQDIDNAVGDANKKLQQVENTLSTLKSQYSQKQKEVKDLQEKLKSDLEEHPTIDACIKDATEQLNLAKSEYSVHEGSSKFYASLLSTGKAKKICAGCNRNLTDKEIPAFEKYLKELIAKASGVKLAELTEDIKAWETDIQRLQLLLPVESTRSKLTAHDIPALQRQIKEAETMLPELSEQAEAAQEKLEAFKKTQKELLALKQLAAVISRTMKETDMAQAEVTRLEADLNATGSSQTAESVQLDLDRISTELRASDRERQNLTGHRDRQNQTLRSLEHDSHGLELTEKTLEGQVKERKQLENSVETMRGEIIKKIAELKELDEAIIAATAPIEALETESRQFQAELAEKTNDAQGRSQALNISFEKLERMSTRIDIYVKGRPERKIKDAEERVSELEGQIKAMARSIEEIRAVIAGIEAEINRQGATTSNLRDNQRLRKLEADIRSTTAEIESHDMEQAAKDKRNFEQTYNKAKLTEEKVREKCAHIGGEISSLKGTLQTLERDFRDFKDINKKYTDQLIKVKMSDMANNDLEKYAKALDNAIMKYHSLKMEEVNDTMRHLWNKTYQGSDIDGIKIRSDNDGGTARRTYNYRVVMTKDQVEMDMRGRCSAGQKMLASIIIRLALSDSFGQNCGILALDEPTNALDTENIDALAQSLVDIIKERRSHSNFQLLIITHDENFLKKLGESEVMEHYWRVSRDARQKSVIEKQRVSI